MRGDSMVRLAVMVRFAVAACLTLALSSAGYADRASSGGQPDAQVIRETILYYLAGEMGTRYLERLRRM